LNEDMIINSKSIKEMYAFSRYENVNKKRFIDLRDHWGCR